MRLIHCADLHLDARMEAHLSPEQARERRGELNLTFERLAAYAVQQGVRAVLIAGDLFDLQRVSPTTARFVLDVMRRAPEVDFCYLCGNHDGGHRAFDGLTLPPNLKRFSDRWQTFEYEEAAVSGIEMTRENCRTFYEGFSPAPDKRNIVMLHGQTSAERGEDRVCLNALRGRGIDYLALGHLHSFQTDRLDGNGLYAYSGCLEGRGFDECGEKGFVLLDCGAAGVQARFVPFAKRAFVEETVDISAASSLPDILALLRGRAATLRREDLIRFVLTGTYPPEAGKDLAFLTDALRPGFYFVQLLDCSTLRLESADYAHDISLRGEFIRQAEALPLSEEERALLIRCGLQALSGEAIIG